MSQNKIETPHEAGVSDRFRKLVAGQFGIDISRVVDDAKFAEDLGADSLDSIELVMATEEEFLIEISDDDATEMKLTVGDAIDYLLRREDLDQTE